MDDIRLHAFEHRVRFDECGADASIRSGGYLRLMQDVAWRHSELLGFDRDWYRDRRVGWLVRFADLWITDAARSGDTLVVTTRVTGWRRVWARRESTASVAGEGGDVAHATIDWVLVDHSGRPARIPDGIAERFTDGVSTFQPGRVTLPEAPPDAVTHAWRVSIRDLDPMAHVNNATYLDVLDETLAAGTGALAGPPPPVRYEVEYLRPALPGRMVSVAHWAIGADALARFRDDDGQELVRARVTRG